MFVKQMMLKIMLIGITCFVLFSHSICFAQNLQPASDSFVVRTKLAKSVFSGLAGAILGLSTLSFYGKPEEHLSNIISGFGIGLVLGAAYITYETAVDLNSGSNVNANSNPELWFNRDSTSRSIVSIRAPLWSYSF
jgi:hypothetical protein